MRNPLRRAYRQLSRLIVNEGFKEFAKLYGFDPNDPNYQEVKNAYAAINDNKNKELKDYYKAKLDEKGIERSNLDLAYTKLFPTPEDFLNSYNEFSKSYKAENRLASLRREREKLIKRYAGNVVQQTSEFIVYKVDNFEDAKEMRWLWMGDVEKLTNEQCKKLDPNAPGDGQSYRGKMTPKEMADYMMSNNEFIMNPSWCVCAGKVHWDSYRCDETNDDGSPSCHLIFSKKFPNCRFCVVKNEYTFEIRDPWQGGGFNEDQRVQYGFDVMYAVFGGAMSKIACLHAVIQEKLLSKFIHVLKKDNVEGAQQILEQGIDPTYKDECGVPLIIYAVQHDAVNVCELLLDNGADVDAKEDVNGDTPLLDAAGRGNTELCELLLERGADINAKNRDSETPLQKAAFGYTEICELLIENGADVNTKDNYGGSPLLWAAYNGRVEICKLLLESGAEIHDKNKYGYTPLHNSAAKCHRETCALLLDHGADVNGKSENDNTPLHLAAGNGRPALCALLLEYGADVNAKNKNGWTPLHWAADNGHTETCEFLLEYGADVNVKDMYDDTPLHKAAWRGHTETCKILLDNGADVNAEDTHGDTPIELAMHGRHTNTRELLRQYAARG